METEKGGQVTNAPLAGIRVLDLSRLLPGGYCTMLLADLGADVIKVEEPGRGDYARWTPPHTPSGESAAHEALGRGKRSLTCNLRTEEGRQILRDLAARADVLVESFRPGVLDRLGVGYRVLQEINPGLVYVAISGYGQTGPYVTKAGHDINYLGYAGALSFSGHETTGPWQPGLQIGDLAGGMSGVIAVLGALRARDATGRGQFCDVSMTDVIMSWLSIHAGVFAATGVPPGLGSETLNGGLACYGVYRCADGRYVAVGALEQQFFAELLAGLGLGEDLRAWHLDGARQPELRARLEEVFATKPRDEWVRIFADRDACVAPVNDLTEAFQDPNARERGMVFDDRLPDGSVFSRLGVIPRFTGTPGSPGGHPSPLGGDTDTVLADLGRTAEQIAALRDAGVV
ncbi:MAG: CoA transferase [Streptosporangiales bacterium]|nr:CoA transferase [Streptosporangiales bacterium]